MSLLIGEYEEAFQGYGRDKECNVIQDETKAQFYDCVYRLLNMAESYGFNGNLWHCYLTDLLVNNENSYSMGCEYRGKMEGTLNEAVLHDLKIFGEFYNYDFSGMVKSLDADAFRLIENYAGSRRESEVYDAKISDCICGMAVLFGRGCSAEEMKGSLTRFYKIYGVGRFGLHKSFRISHEEDGVKILPIPNIARVRLDDLIGYELPKKKLTDNTQAFVDGGRANNCLLYGGAGTGKSSCVKAIANAFYEKGLRVIEVYRHQYRELNDVIRQIKYRNYKFIIYMDDLSFEDFETDYKYLKAVIEGGLEKKPENVLIYATSNRRHLIRETYGDKMGSALPPAGDNFTDIREDMHMSDTVQEKLSLAARFGVTILFDTPDKKEFNNIVLGLAKRSGIKMEGQELLLMANQWELSHGGMSGRTAQQFIDYLLGYRCAAQ